MCYALHQSHKLVCAELFPNLNPTPEIFGAVFILRLSSSLINAGKKGPGIIVGPIFWMRASFFYNRAEQWVLLKVLARSSDARTDHCRIFCWRWR